MRKRRALIIEDDAEHAESLAHIVQREDFVVSIAETLANAGKVMRSDPPDVVLLDRNMPDGDGLSFMSRRSKPHAPEVVVITGYGDVDSAVGCLRNGALDYLTKPVDRGRLVAALGHVDPAHAAQYGPADDEEGEAGRSHAGIIGGSASMRSVYDLVAAVAPTEATVLITGESGTGKEVVAQALHERSQRSSAPLETVNCGAIPETLIESELFGHEKGTFTGAERQHKGIFERADGGTLFLDEVTEMPIELQVRLLRVLETGEVRRLGGGGSVRVDVRVIAATNRDPRAAIEAGLLREDLYYRLAVFPIDLPSLRQRTEDVGPLARHFLDELNRENEAAKRFRGDALRALEGRPWKGNVRELKNVVHRAFILADEEITPAHVAPIDLFVPTTTSRRVELAVGSTIADMERRLIEATLKTYEGDKTAVANVLGISLKTLYNRLKVYQAMES